MASFGARMLANPSNRAYAYMMRNGKGSETVLIGWLEKRICGDAGAALDAPARRRGGFLASVIGLGVNALLFAIKLAAGVVSGSVSIMADAFNNLSDASSSVISLIGFKLAAKPAD